ncbi:MAG: class A beta-lactamase-related serine hydrolase [Dorea sp.]|nr:class A beta-lactamase-related serine hydrolase [Dorea sp.]
MKKIKWENVLAIVIALTYGLVIGIWCGHFFDNGIAKNIEQGVRNELTLAENEDGNAGTPLVLEEGAKAVSDKDGIFDVKERRPIKVRTTLNREEICEEIDARAAFEASVIEALKITDKQELYEILDHLSDSTKIKKFGKHIKIKKKHMKELKAAVKDLEENGYRISFLAMDLDFGFGISKGAQEVFYSASALKGPYVGAAVSQMPDRAGAYESTIYQVLKYSSNDGYETLRYGFGPQVIENWYKETNIDNLNVREHYSDMTPVQFAKLWVRNWEYLTSDEEKADWLKPLYENSLNAVISEGLADENTHVYSKAGWIADYSCGTVQNDAGIVDHDNQEPYVMVIMSSAYMQNDRLQRVVRALDQVFRDMRK